jgi:hypothetical protein
MKPRTRVLVRFTNFVMLIVHTGHLSLCRVQTGGGNANISAWLVIRLCGFFDFCYIYRQSVGNDRCPIFVQLHHSQVTDVRTVHQSWECGVTIVTRSLTFIYAENRKHFGKHTLFVTTVFRFRFLPQLLF